MTVRFHGKIFAVSTGNCPYAIFGLGSGSFAFLVILGILYLFIITMFFKESLQKKDLDALKIKPLFRVYSTLLKNPQFICYSFVSCCSYTLYFSYITVSPVIIIDMFHYNVKVVSWVLALNSTALLVMNIIVPIISNKINLNKLLAMGGIALLIGTGILYITNLHQTNLWKIVLPFAIVCVGVGIIRPTASAGAMNIIPSQMAGKTAGMYNFISFIGAGITTYFVNLLVKDNIHPFVYLMLAISILGMFFSLLPVITKRTINV